MNETDKDILKHVMKRVEYISDHIGEVQDTDLLKHIAFALWETTNKANNEIIIKEKIDELL